MTSMSKKNLISRVLTLTFTMRKRSFVIALIFNKSHLNLVLICSKNDSADKFSREWDVYDCAATRKNGVANEHDCAACACTIGTIIINASLSNPANVYQCTACNAFICSECKSKPLYFVEAGKRRIKKKRW